MQFGSQPVVEVPAISEHRDFTAADPSKRFTRKTAGRLVQARRPISETVPGPPSTALEQPPMGLLETAVPTSGKMTPHPLVGVKLSDLLQVLNAYRREPKSLRADAVIRHTHGSHPLIVPPTRMRGPADSDRAAPRPTGRLHT